MLLEQKAPDVWHLDVDAAVALGTLVSPFADPRFLGALERLDGRWAAYTIGAVADDGTRAALAVASRGSAAVSVPFGYGGILADRSLEESEVIAFLRLAARHLGVREVRSRYLPLPIRGRPAHTGGRVIASTAVVSITGTGEDLDSRLAKKARQSIRRSQRAGVVVSIEADPGRFLDVYAVASHRFRTAYPPDLIRGLASSGLGRAYDAMIGDEVVASAFALIGRSEWMYWLAAETERGRRVEAGYPIVAQLLADARDAGASFVNLGASTGLPGVAKFKRRLASVDLPVIEHTLVLPRVSLGPRGVFRDRMIRTVARMVQETKLRRRPP